LREGQEGIVPRGLLGPEQEFTDGQCFMKVGMQNNARPEKKASPTSRGMDDQTLTAFAAP
jgi:hypothetical protein